MLDDKKFISARKAAEITGYEQDYVGQLARMGRVLARQIGRAWFIEEQSLLSHKSEGRAKKKSKNISHEAAVASKDTFPSVESGDIPASPPASTSEESAQAISTARKEVRDALPSVPELSQPSVSRKTEDGISIPIAIQHDREEIVSGPAINGEQILRNNIVSSPIRDDELLTYIVNGDDREAVSANKINIQEVADLLLPETSPMAAASINAKGRIRTFRRNLALPAIMGGAAVIALAFLLSVMVFDERTFSREGQTFAGERRYEFRGGGFDKASFASVLEIFERLF